MTVGAGSTTAEAEIRALIAAVIVLFDVVNPLRSKRPAEWFSSFRGPIGYELRNLTIAAGDDEAFCHGRKRVRAATTTGQRLDMGSGATICYRKVDGARQVTHEHASVPIDVASGRAALDLEP